MIIENIKSKDIKKVMALEREVFKENAFSNDLMSKFIHYSKERRNTIFLKLEKNAIKKDLIGFIIIIKDRIDRANIVNFLINPKFQNKSYGSFLLKEALKKIKSMKGIKRVVLNVQVNNKIAIRLYEKFNFKKLPDILENYYQSGESSYAMELIIENL
ncbi:MAG: GNAT family N-acetyltransferase [Promethearchaeota archaeon]|jgi:ribosomal protein S18 acetylase RimI-like enzyme